MTALADLKTLQSRLQHPFADAALLRRALTHRSHSADHNERLEFLGDSVLNLAVAHMLYEALGQLPEGDLSRMRAQLVRREAFGTAVAAGALAASYRGCGRSTASPAP